MKSLTNKKMFWTGNAILCFGFYFEVYMLTYSLLGPYWHLLGFGSLIFGVILIFFGDLLLGYYAMGRNEASGESCDAADYAKNNFNPNHNNTLESYRGSRPAKLVTGGGWKMKIDGIIFLVLAVIGCFTWGSSFITDITKYDYSTHYTEWLNPALITVIIYIIPAGIIVLLATFGILALRDKRKE